MTLLLLLNVAFGIVFAEGLLRGSLTDIAPTNSLLIEGKSAVSNAEFRKAVDPAIDALLADDGDETAESWAGAVRGGAATIDPRQAASTLIHKSKELPKELRDVLPELAKSQGQMKNPKAKTMKSSEAKHPLLNISQKDLSGMSQQEPAKLDVSKEAVEKAVAKLNGMIESSQRDLDAKAIECQEFKIRTRTTIKQVRTDIGTLDRDMTMLLGQAGKATNGLEQNADAQNNIQTTLFEAEMAYNRSYQKNAAIMAVVKEDLAITTFMLQITKCKDGGFIQQPAAMQIESCTNSDGNTEYTFSDSRLEDNKQRLTPQARELLGFALERATLGGGTAGEALRAAGLAYGSSSEELDDGDGPEELGYGKGSDLEEADAEEVLNDQHQDSELSLVKVHTTKRMNKTQKPGDDPKKEKKQSKRCSKMKPDCGLLHDTFSILWGGMKDKFEALQTKMDNELLAFNTLKSDKKDELTTLDSDAYDLNSHLTDTQGERSSKQMLQSKKIQEQRLLIASYNEKMGECRAEIREILYTEICGTISVRNELVTNVITDIKMEDIVDCEVTRWAPSQCSVPCDDELIGGTKRIEREIMVGQKTYGAACPVLNMTMKCGEFKCPVNCALEDWQGWSTCTMECGGGVQARTRQVKDGFVPRNGGTPCTPLEEPRPCNTFSCDRDCTLLEWTPWTHCSQMCDGGKHFMYRTVDPEAPPVRGEGSCPAELSSERYKEENCNMQKCNGDEVCIATMDVVLLIDGSGSLTEKGFAVLKDYASMIVKKLKAESYGRQNIRVGIVQFGNGHLDSNDVVSDAIVVQSLEAWESGETDMGKTVKAIKGMKWQRGFTNMAQGILKAQNLLSKHGRKNAVGTVLMITDGSPSFQLQTNQSVEKLRETSTLVIVHIKSNPSKNTIQLMSSYASKPISGNYLIIPGKKTLKENMAKLVRETIVKTCPEAMSPSQTGTLVGEQGFQLYRRGMYCQDMPDGYGAPIGLRTPADCKAQAAEQFMEWNFFDFGPSDHFDDEYECHIFKKACEKYEEKEGWMSYMGRCSGEDMDRFSPDIGGCCSGLVECVEDRPMSDRHFCPKGVPGYDETCFDKIVMCRTKC